jgi:hypothetical protein
LYANPTTFHFLVRKVSNHNLSKWNLSDFRVDVIAIKSKISIEWTEKSFSMKALGDFPFDLYTCAGTMGLLLLLLVFRFCFQVSFVLMWCKLEVVWRATPFKMAPPFFAVFIFRVNCACAKLISLR